MEFVNQFYQRLGQNLGAERARQCVEETLAAMGKRQLDTADDVVVFARLLMQRGGLFDVIGRALRVQAILRGGKEPPPPAGRPPKRSVTLPFLPTTADPEPPPGKPRPR
jgi:hypothetical protein